ncbi:hypothetical protein J6590_093549 [Homalodisca vitripennis]|nr:hypothetical protein J6590_093549 [Homalodisca vitripennis]
MGLTRLSTGHTGIVTYIRFVFYQKLIRDDESQREDTVLCRVQIYQIVQNVKEIRVLTLGGVWPEGGESERRGGRGTSVFACMIEEIGWLLATRRNPGFIPINNCSLFECKKTRAGDAAAPSHYPANPPTRPSPSSTCTH